MVNADRVKRKLPSLLCDGPTTDKQEWAKRHRIENASIRLRKHDAVKYQSLEQRLIRDLEALETAVQKTSINIEKQAEKNK